MDDVLLNKIAIIERCVHRIQEEYGGYESLLETDLTRQDSIVLNLQRACEAAIDVGLRLVRKKQLGVPQSSRDVFVLLEHAKIIPSDLSKALQAMVGFRNVAIHEYQKLNPVILRHILAHRLGDLTALTRFVMPFASEA